MDGIQKGKSIEQTEQLKLKEKYHDYLITSLRTKWGADPVYLEAVFGKQVRLHFVTKAQSFIKLGNMYISSGKVAIDPRHWLITDHILRTLFLD